MRKGKEVYRASPDPMHPFRKAWKEETLASKCLIPLAFSLASAPEHLLAIWVLRHFPPCVVNF